ncbi:MAG TPA: sulfatase-like hydrolase/transferase, partial [Acidobacteriota bacterium]|nr:sulfatase-like hydrolase/transferase [Acidobacteriota bacterium]
MTKKFSQLIIVIGVVAVASALAIYFFKTHRRSIELNAGGYKDFNILLVTLDTVRADHLGTYGYNRVRTPNLDHLGSESFVFEDAIAHVPLTLPSHVSIMTGRLPIAHGVRDNAGFVLNQNEITLAEALKDQGYTTAAFVSATVLESRWKLNQGFDVYDDYFKNVVSADLSNEVERHAADTEKVSSQWLDKNHAKKFFIWVHFYDAHDPYSPPEPFKSAYSDDPYDGEIAYVDDAVGKLLAKLDTLQLKQRTIVIVTSDHGEGLGEHREPTHGVFLYNTTQHVPLIIFLPGAEGKRISGSVCHIDLAPTILQLIGAKAQSKMQGKSLIAKINGNDNQQRSVYSESLYAQLHYGWSKLESITTDQYRYIYSPKPELFDRKADKAESNNLLQEKASIAKVLNSKLTEMIQQFSSAHLAGPQKIDPETEEKLRALGYIGTTVNSTEESRKVDPKDKAEVILQIQEASGLLGQQKYAQALDKVLPVLQQDSGMIDAHYVAGLAYLQLGKFNDAVTELRKTLELNPQDTRAMYNLGFAFELMKQPKDAEFWYLKALQLNPENT